MPHQISFAARLRTVLLATTGLVVAGCNTISDQSATADPSQNEQTPVVTASEPKDSSGKLTMDSLMRVADRAWAKNDAPTALRLYATAAKDYPKNPTPLLKIAEILRKTGRPENAINVYGKVLEIDSNHLDAHHGIGYSYLQAEKPYLAAESFKTALGIDENNAKSLGGIAVAYDKAGDREAAQSYYKKAINADPANLNYKSNLALSFALSGESEKAIAILKIVTENPGATAKHRQNLALVYGMVGQSKEAMKYSRMDLSEKDARNNELYFQALNESPDEQAALISDQVNVMNASKDTVPAEAAKAKSQPRQPKDPGLVVARVNTDTLNANNKPKAKGKSAVTEAPKSLVPAPASSVMVAKAAPPKMKKPVVAPIVVAKSTAPPAPKPVKTVKAVETPKPKVVAKAENPAPAVEMKKAVMADAPKAKVTKPTTFGKKDTTSEVTVVAEAKPAPAPKYKEWKIKEKSDPVVTSKETVVAKRDESATAPAPATKKISFVPSNMPINGEVSPKKEAISSSAVSPVKPDGGKYFLQLGSYKEQTQAEKGWKIIQSQNVDILDGMDPVINQADLGADGGGSFYRVQVGGFSNKADPMRLCGTLRDRNFDCFMAGPSTAVPKKIKPSTLAPDQMMVDTSPKATKEDNIVADQVKAFGAL